MIAGVEGEYFAGAQTAIQVALLRHNGDALLDAHRVGHYIDARNMSGTAGWQDACGEHANGSRFARSVGSEQAEDFAAPH